MIPPLLLVGVLLGIGIGSRHGLRLAAVGCLAFSGLWGVGIGASNDALTGLGAAGLAAANVAVGVIVGALAAWPVRRATSLAS